jgi:hypothetical protein
MPCRLLLASGLLFPSSAATVSAGSPRLFLAGDSMMANKPLDLPERGWGTILATPVCRRTFDAAGKLVMTHGEYPDALRAVAAEEKVPRLDLERATAAWLQATGDQASKAFVMWIEPGRYPQLPEGRRDDTHFVEAGARRVAGTAVAQIRELRVPLADWLKQAGDV